VPSEQVKAQAIPLAEVAPGPIERNSQHEGRWSRERERDLVLDADSPVQLVVQSEAVKLARRQEVGDLDGSAVGVPPEVGDRRML
jgi:hypothetical protein